MVSKIMKIPFNKPEIIGNELEYIRQAYQLSHISGDGFFTKKVFNYFKDKLNVKKSLLTTSCTHALEMAALLLNIKPGDEFIAPSFTFVSTINAFMIRGGVPIFVDIRSDTLNIDENLIEKSITKKTKAILVVHYAGVACEMKRIIEIGEKYKIPIIEDNAHGLFGKYENQNLGTFGLFSAQSFHETKNISCGEGGSIFINNRNYYERAEIIREKGTNRAQFNRGSISKYSWKDIGSSYLPSDILAAILYAKLENLETIQAKRKLVWHNYYENLIDWAYSNKIKLPYVPKNCSQSYHMFYMLLPNNQTRNKMLVHLNKKGFMAVFHYLPLHLSKMGKGLGWKKGDLPNTEKASDCLVRLPFFYSLNLDLVNFNYFYDFKK